MDPEERRRLAQVAFPDNRFSGRVNVLDAPRAYDLDGIVVAMFVDVAYQQVIRCALSRNQAIAGLPDFIVAVRGNGKC